MRQNIDYSKMHFQMSDKCTFIKGPLRSILFDSQTQNALHLQPRLSHLFDNLAQGKSLQDAAALASCSSAQARQIAAELINQGVGVFCFDSPVPQKEEGTKQDMIAGRKTLIVEVTNACSLNCLFCHAEDRGRIRLEGCNRYCQDTDESELSFLEWREILEMFYGKGFTNLRVTGGDPLLRWDLTHNLIEFASNCGFEEIGLETNGLEMTPDIATFLYEKNVHIIIQFFGFEPDIFDHLSGREGAFDQLFENLEFLLSLTPHFSFRIPLCEENIENIEDTKQIVTSLGSENIFVSSVISKDLDEIYKWDKPHYFAFPEEDIETQSIKHEICLEKFVYVTAFGNVLPCQAAREHVLGKMFIDDLSTIMAQRETFIGKAKEIRGICGQCELRTSCLRCPLLVYRKHHSFAGKDPRCEYHPESGEWKSINAELLKVQDAFQE